MVTVILFGAAACGESVSGGEGAVARYDETLFCGFDTQEEILDKTLGMKEIREYKVTTDEQYVTQGTGALKFTYDSDDSDYYMPSAKDISPAIYILINETGYGKDLSNLKEVAVDIYNTTDRNLSVALYQRTKIGEVKITDLMSSAYLIKPGANKCVIDTELDRNVNFGMDNVSELCLVFPRVYPHESAVTLYIDNLRFRTLKDGDAPQDQDLPASLTDGKVASFEEKSFYNKTMLGSFRKTQPLQAFWNGNPDYITDGARSFGVMAECGGEMWRDERPYADIILPDEYVKEYDFSVFAAETCVLKADMYLKGTEDLDRFSFTVKYETESGENSVMKQDFILKANEWNTLEFPMSFTVNEKSVEWNNVIGISFRFWQQQGGGTTIYYLDNIRVEG